MSGPTDRGANPGGAELPQHARERLQEMQRRQFFTSDLSVNEFLLVKEAGFEPLGLVMGSSIHRIRPDFLTGLFGRGRPGEIAELTQALYRVRELAMTRMEEEADLLGADGVIGVRLTLNVHAWGKDVTEFLAVGTAVRHGGGESYRNKQGRPFTSDLSGQDFWTLVRAGLRPCGMVLGNCAYYVPPEVVRGRVGAAAATSSHEVADYTRSLYDARELAIERVQAEAEALGATGIVGVSVRDQQVSWDSLLLAGASRALERNKKIGELIEFFVVGNAVVATGKAAELPEPTLVLCANDPEEP